MYNHVIQIIHMKLQYKKIIKRSVLVEGASDILHTIILGNKALIPDRTKKSQISKGNF